MKKKTSQPVDNLLFPSLMILVGSLGIAVILANIAKPQTITSSARGRMARWPTVIPMPTGFSIPTVTPCEIVPGRYALTTMPVNALTFTYQCDDSSQVQSKTIPFTFPVELEVNIPDKYSSGFSTSLKIDSIADILSGNPKVSNMVCKASLSKENGCWI